MARSGGSIKNPWILVLLLLVGSLVGSLIGQLLSVYVPALHNLERVVRLAPRALHLADILSLTFGFVFRINIATVLGMALAIWVYRKL
jgi:membrane protein YqaA with SNARE-associated domain